MNPLKTYTEDVSYANVARRRTELESVGWRIVSSTRVDDAVLTVPTLRNGMYWFDHTMGSGVRLRYTKAPKP